MSEYLSTEIVSRLPGSGASPFGDRTMAELLAKRLPGTGGSPRTPSEAQPGTGGAPSLRNNLG